MENSDHWENLAAGSGWSPCADCGVWMPKEMHIETPQEEWICLACMMARYCQNLLEYEKSALEDDDPSGGCAAHHRGAIGAYERILKVWKDKK